ncbi:Xanthine and CO dehydrogenases maturation factor, XdhC/CoxF family [hydrothermal vent metagenome]|uniref:Xanthine and CO dehydrogenases maturation factor, XdhC/CoxF family n=1 Tax=hydrothermal vent metagenome TaxID=652676 RepID=A0A3B0UQI5_9ZZZZ
MTHELKAIFESFALAKQQGIKTVLATVVDLEGSSYRKPGVRMLIWQNGFMLGAVSGGCVEKEVLKQSHSVFETGTAKMITYDGRYRLGCEGIIYILLEVFEPNLNTQTFFADLLAKRLPFKIVSSYDKSTGSANGYGSAIFSKKSGLMSFSGDINNLKNSLKLFTQEMSPCNQLLIMGAEHDAVDLCKLADFLGWQVSIVCSVLSPKKISDFPGATKVLALPPDRYSTLEIDANTAVILMSHNYASDLKNLLAIKEREPFYIGVLGAKKRKEKLLDEFLSFHPEAEEAFLEKVHGPAGLDIGAITPQEIAISIMAELMAVLRKKQEVLSTKISHQELFG